MLAWVVGWAMPLGWAEEPPRVLAVEVQGTRAIANETCLAQMQTRPGVPYLESVVSEDIRRLYALGYFTDVRVQTETLPGGIKVIVVVKEKPAVGAIEVGGHRFLQQKRIQELLGVAVGDLYDPRKVKDGIDQIKAHYQRKGYSQVAIESSASTDETANTVTVALVVDEGPRMRIARIFLEGNLAFPDRRILKLMKTKRRALFSAGVYAEQVLEEDLERIRAFYRKHGYEDAAVAHEMLAAPSGRSLFLHLRVTEGQQHRVGRIAIAGTVLFPEHELRRLLTLKPGAVYNPEALQADLRAIKQYYGDRGYINAQVTPQTRLEPATKQVDLAFQIVESELAYVERVEVRGNLRTKDVVIRRELRIRPGDRFDGASIRRSIERLYNLGIFEEVAVDTEPTAVPNREDLVVDVKEAKTGSVSFGGGVSSIDRLVGMVSVEQRNFDLSNWPTFTGAGQDVRFQVEAGSVRRNFDLSFTEPWIFGHPLSFGVDGYSHTRLRSRNVGLAFEEEQQGGRIRLGKELTDTLRLDWNYQLFRTEISDIVAEASADLRAEQGRSDISVTGLGLSWDTRDNRFDPTRGAFLFSSVDLAGGVLAGDRDFFRLQGGASGYVPHGERFVLEGRVRAGVVNEYAGTAEVPIFERFFAGGANTIRGFRERRVGPRDPKSNDPIGGEASLLMTIEEVMTLVSDERQKPILRGALFFDAGNVWRRVDDFASSLEAGTGLGARVNTPIGPLRLDVGFPLTRVEGDKTRRPRLHFNVSRSF